MDSAPATVPFALDDGSIDLAVRRSRRARRIWLRVDPSGAGAELVVPGRVGLDEALRFAQSQRGWLSRRLAATPPPIAFAPGAAIPVFGETLAIHHQPDARGPVRRDGDALVVAGAAEHVARRVRDWLKAQARLMLTRQSHALAARVQRRVSGIRLGDPKSRWGSCSRTGALAYSWRLILAPRDVLDYVVAHEVAHLVHLNHSRRFWSLVGELVGDVRPPRQWLRRNGTQLLRYGLGTAGQDRSIRDRSA